MAETSFDIIDGVCYVSTDERKWIGKIMRLSTENEGVKVLRKPE